MFDVSVAAGQSGSVFFCDLDGLKTINDTYGHEIGDLAINTEAKVLLKAEDKNLYEEKKIKHAKMLKKNNLSLQDYSKSVIILSY
ncbi:MAG: diguanylate cyclase [Spirochaetia bacterium]|nr:diguanylate cyclase [Spirochaetia bacterium]